MKFKINYLFAALVALLAATWQAEAQDPLTAYATVNVGPGQGTGVYTFDIKSDTVDNVQLYQQLTYSLLSGSALVNGKFYYLDYEQTYRGYSSNGLYALDMETRNVSSVADYGGQDSGPIASHFAWNAQDNTLYALNGLGSGTGLVKINLENGTISPVCTFTFDGQPEAAKQYTGGPFDTSMNTIAIDYDGDMYGVSYWAGLYKINYHTGACTYIGALDYNPDKAYMYMNNCLFFDNETDDLYFRLFTYYGNKYELAKINKKTAHVDIVSKLTYTTENYNINAAGDYDGITIPYTPAEASAPAKPQNATITRGDNGALTATISWDNPSKTYGRGGTLEELDSVVVFRDGERVYAQTNPTIGGHETYTDNVPARGYYSYRIVPYNGMGRGDRVTIGGYIGAGDPVAPLNPQAKAVDSSAVVTWGAPKEGLNASWIDTADLKYDITRLPDSVVLATDYADTTFTDTTLAQISKVTYNIVAKTGGHNSAVASTDAVVAGPSIKLPYTYTFQTQNDFDLWTTIDADGQGSTWCWQEGRYGTTYGANIMYNYETYAPLDWLISPYMTFEGGKHYKMTFTATPGSKYLVQNLDVSFGTDNTIATQDSVTSFSIQSESPVQLRANLPVINETGTRHVGFRYTTQYQNFNLTLSDIAISEDHDGYIEGTVTAGGKPVADALLIVNAGQFTATTDKNGHYMLNYLPSGDQTITVQALGYDDKDVVANVVELDTTTINIELTALPEYKVSGHVVDIAGDPVANAQIAISGYNTYETSTDANGDFSVDNVYKNGNYAVSITKNKLNGQNKSFGVESDTDLGTFTLTDAVRPVRSAAVVEDKTANTTKVSWASPANDPVVDRIDDGTLTTTVGISNPDNKCVFGVIRRQPSTVHGVQFYLGGASTLTHYSVQLHIFSLDSLGNPTPNELYYRSYVPVTDDQWTTYTLPAPVEAPNGYYIAIGAYNYMNIGIDGAGDSQKYPFQEGVNCFTNDYTSGNYWYLESQSSPSLHHNFLMRPIAAPYTVDDDSTAYKSNAPLYFKPRQNDTQLELSTRDDFRQMGEKEAPEPLKTVQSRIRYNVYRTSSADLADESKWTLVSEKQKPQEYTDNEWNTLPQGTYAYAVKAVYTGDTISSAVTTDTIGHNMITSVKVKLMTNTPDNEAYGAKVSIITGGGRHYYEGTADEDGNVTINGIWKGSYDLTVQLDGFKTITDTLDLSIDNEYTFAYNLVEDQVQPFNLIIEDGSNPQERVFMWNYPDLFTESFEDHPDFEINSPGSIGWQYVDGDDTETGGFRNYTWKNEFQKMAYIVFNPYQAYNSDSTSSVGSAYSSTMAPHSGQKYICDWAAYNVANDDWIITPKLYFKKPFKFTFWAKSSDYGYSEDFQVLYSTTDADTASFTVLATEQAPYDNYSDPARYTHYSYDLPADAKYVAIRCTSYNKRVFMVDDIAYGTADELNSNSGYYVPVYKSGAKPSRRMPSLDGAYDVFLDYNKVTSTDDTRYTFSNLSAGKHTAGVRACYTSGITAMSTIDFEVTVTGIQTIAGSETDVVYNGRKLSINGDYDNARLYDVSGKMMPMGEAVNGQYNLNSLPAGTYILRLQRGNNASSMKFVVK